MSEYQKSIFIKMILQIVKDSKDKEDAIEKLEKLIENSPEEEKK